MQSTWLFGRAAPMCCLMWKFAITPMSPGEGLIKCLQHWSYSRDFPVTFVLVLLFTLPNSYVVDECPFYLSVRSSPRSSVMWNSSRRQQHWVPSWLSLLGTWQFILYTWRRIDTPIIQRWVGMEWRAEISYSPFWRGFFHFRVSFRYWEFIEFTEFIETLNWKSPFLRKLTFCLVSVNREEWQWLQSLATLKVSFTWALCLMYELDGKSCCGFFLVQRHYSRPNFQITF